MVRVIAKNFNKPELVPQIEPLFREILDATNKKDEGCIEYRLYTDPNVKGMYIFIEEWESQAALDKHMASEHFLRLIPQIRAAASQKNEAQILTEFK